MGTNGTNTAHWPSRRRDLGLAAAGASVVHLVAYFLANQFPRGAPRELTMTLLDHAVPFLPWTVFIYLSAYVMIIGTFLTCRRRTTADRYVVGQLVLIGVSTLTHWAMPVAFPRGHFPVPADLASAPAYAMELLRSFDAPTSCMPSLHVSTVVLAALLIQRDRPRAFPWLLAWAGLIALSTMTTKQHYLLDVVAGLVLAMVVAVAASRVSSWLGVGLNDRFRKDDFVDDR